jgi:hypothetical protein
VAALREQLQAHVGAARLGALEADGPEGPGDLYLQHLAQLAGATGLDLTGYLPWSAPPSWVSWVAPYYRVLWAEQQRPAPAALSTPDAAPGLEDGPGAPSLHAGSGTDSATATAGGVNVSRLAEPGLAPEDDEWLGEWFERTIAAAGPGRPLSALEQRFLERVHGRPVPGVRLHEGSAAAEAARGISARAFSLGGDLFLPGGVDLDRPEDAELLAHESTHALQAAEGRLPSTPEAVALSNPSDPHEQEAERRGREGRRLAADPWGLSGAPLPGPEGQALLAVLSSELPDAEVAPPAELVREVLGGWLSARVLERVRGAREGALSPAAGEILDAVEREALGTSTQPAQLGRWLSIVGAPGASELAGLRREAPYPELEPALVEQTRLLSGAALEPDLMAALEAPDEGAAEAASEASGAVMRWALGAPEEDPDVPGGPGQPLSPELAARFGAALGADLRHARVHTDGAAAEAARALGARAFTLGSHVYFGAGEFRPGVSSGDRLLLHELTHVVQDDEGRLPSAQGLEVSSPSDAAEQEASAAEGLLSELGAEGAVGEHRVAMPEGAPRAPSSPEGGVIHRFDSAVPDGELGFHPDASGWSSELQSVLQGSLAGPVSTHKVDTGQDAAALDQQPDALPSAVLPAALTVGGEPPTPAVDQEAPAAAEEAPGPPEQEAPEGEVEQEPGEVLDECRDEEQQSLDEAMGEQVSLPEGDGQPPADSEGGEDSDSGDSRDSSSGGRSSNEEEVSEALDGVDGQWDGDIDRPEAPALELTGDADPALVQQAGEGISNCMSGHAMESLEAQWEGRGEDEAGPTEALESQSLDPSDLVCEAPEESAESIYQQALAESGLDGGQYPFSEDVDVISDQLQSGQGELDACYEDLDAQLSEGLESLEGDAGERYQQQLEEARRRESDAHGQMQSQVDGARQSWSDEADAAYQQSRDEAQCRVDEAGRQIDAERERFDREVEAAIDETVAEAEAEQASAERRVAAEQARVEREAEGGGFWDWVGSVLDSVISAITSFISAVFDALNWLIQKLFEGLSWIIEGLVDLIQGLIVGIIRLLQAGLELLCELLEATLGEQATRWVRAIHSFIDGLVDVLNAIFDWLGEALAGVLDFISQGLQALVTLIKWGVTIMVMLMTGLWVRYLWLAIEHFDRLWNNIWASFDGLWGELVARSGPAWEEFWTNFWTPGNQLLLAIGAIVFIAGLFVGISEVVAIIMLILAALYLATVVVHVGEQFITWCEQIWNDDIGGARQTLADTLLYLLFNAPLILLAIFGIKSGLKGIGRGGGRGGAGEGGTGEGGTGRGGNGRGGNGEGGTGEGGTGEGGTGRGGRNGRGGGEEGRGGENRGGEEGRGTEEGRGSEETLNGRWRSIQERFNVPDDVMEVLRESGVAPDVVESLLSKGMDPVDAGLYALEYGASGLRTIEGLMNRGIAETTAMEVARLAHENGVQSAVETLARSPNLRNPQTLRSMLRELAKGKDGLRGELTEAANRVAQGHEVTLGQRMADVVDHTAQEAIQMKEITSADPAKVSEHTAKASDQLAGEHGETPPAGYTRIAHIRLLNPENPLYGASRAQVRPYVLEGVSGKTAVDVVEVHVGPDAGPHIFRAPTWE